MEKSYLQNLRCINNASMSKSISLSIPIPCHEKWNTFTPTSKGGFCSSCQKEVIDFTSWSEDELKTYFKKGQENTCGKFMPAQLTTYSRRSDNNKSIHWLPMSALSLLLFLSSREAKAQEVKVPQHKTIMLGKVINEQSKSDTAVKKITGIVYNETGITPLAGVNIMLKGTEIGTSTDNEGKFSLTIDDPSHNDTLQFSLIGYHLIERSIFSQNNFTILMNPEFDIPGLMGSTAGCIVVRRFPRNIWWRIKNMFR